jgi:prophage DNA circulation protein
MSTIAQNSAAQFDAALPTPYKENWREAYRANTSESPRMASYQAPGGEAIPFVQKSFRFSGGQSQDTAEYPFGGLWSNEYLNEKPQSLTVEGYLRGSAYIAERNKLIEALRVPTDDDNPGYIDLPFWGRFPVVVDDNYEVSEHTDEQGQCAISISFTRAGVSVTERLDSLPSADVQLENAAGNLENAAIDDFESNLSGGRLDNATFASGFGQIKIALLGVIGRIQGAQTVLNTMTNEVLGITNLINRGIRAPYELAKALFNAGASIAGGIMEIKNSIAMYGRMFNKASGGGSSGSNDSPGSGGNGSSDSGVSRTSSSTANKPSLPLPDNEKNALVQFLSASTYTIPAEAVTVSQEATKKAIENLYRTMAFLVSSKIIANMDSLTYQKAGAYWRLIKRLAENIDQESPAVYAAIQDMCSALARKLSGRELSTEMSRRVSLAPLLYLAYFLGCDEDKIRELNSVADSFTVEGNVIYV